MQVTPKAGSKLESMVWTNGTYILDAIDILNDMDPAEVLPYLFDSGTIEKYLKVQKTKLSAEILTVFTKEHVFKEDDSVAVVFDDDFVIDYLDGSQPISKLKRDLMNKKIPFEELYYLREMLIDNPDFKLIAE